MNNLDDIITPTFNWLKEKNKVAIATVISTWGSAPRQVGGQMAINETGEIIGSVSGGCVENSVITEALDSLKDNIILTSEFFRDYDNDDDNLLDALEDFQDNDDSSKFDIKSLIEDVESDLNILINFEKITNQLNLHND